MLESVVSTLKTAQTHICDTLLTFEPKETAFTATDWSYAPGGGGQSRALAGQVFEKAGVNFSHIHGITLPKAATLKKPEIAGEPFDATGVSLVLHPHNPYVPTAHANFRFFQTPSTWWFGGGFDLTPYYFFEEDAHHWHQTAQQSCARLGPGTGEYYRKQCDDYFYLPHREEPRGIGGLFFDDLNTPDLETCLHFLSDCIQGFLNAYLPILTRRKDTPFGDAERAFQAHRRGRYVEFNLLHDRGTLFGLQAGGRADSILMSMPPTVAWPAHLSDAIKDSEQQLLAQFAALKTTLNT